MFVQVVQTKTLDQEGYCSVQLGIGAKRDKQLNRRQAESLKQTITQILCTKYVYASLVRPSISPLEADVTVELLNLVDSVCCLNWWQGYWHVG